MRLNAKRTLAVLLLAVLLLSGCRSRNPGIIPVTKVAASPTPAAQPPAASAASPTPSAQPRAGGPRTLRDLASQKGFLIGTAVNARALQSDQAYAQTLAQEFNVVVPENVMKFANVHPKPQVYDFTAADQLVNFATANGMRVRGHTLVWYQEDPGWVRSGGYTRDQLEQILHDHISAVVGRYKGRIFAWDVVNEAIDDNGRLRDNVWLRGIGPEYIDLAFQWAHEADPGAVLFYNDYNGEGMGTKSDAIYGLVSSLRTRGVPIGGVGLQMHVSVTDPPSEMELKENIERLAALGLVIHITEMDVRIPQPVTASSLDAQAQIYQSTLETCLADEPACQALVMWGFTDKYSSVPNIYPGFAEALVFDANFNPKPAYHLLEQALGGQ